MPHKLIGTGRALLGTGAEIDPRLIFDLFTGPGNLDAHDIDPVNVPDTSWTEQVGAWTIINAAAAGSDVARCNSWNSHATADSEVSDCVLSAVVCTSGGAVSWGNSPGIIVRWTSTTEHWKVLLLGDGTFGIYEYNTLRDSVDMGTPGVTRHLITVTLSGQTITAHIDGGSEISYGSAALNETATVHGIASGNAAHYLDNFAVLARGTAEPESVRFVAIGDSNTAGASSWFWLTVNGIHDSGDEYCTNGYNYAQAGATVNNPGPGHMADQINSANADDANIALIQIGVNDCAALDQSIYTTNLNQLKSDHPNAQIYAMGIFPTTGACQAARDSVNVKIAAAVATAGARCTYWSTDGWIDPATDTTDGLHLNASGHTKVKNQVFTLLGY